VYGLGENLRVCAHAEGNFPHLGLPDRSVNTVDSHMGNVNELRGAEVTSTQHFISVGSSD